MHFIDFLLYSAGFGIVAVLLNLYLVYQEQGTMRFRSSLPSLFVLLSILGGALLHHETSEELFELQKNSATIEEKLWLEQKYSRWAKLTATGVSPYDLDLRVAHSLKPAFKNTELGLASPRAIDCGENGLATFKKVIDRYPDYPFSYAYVASCYKDNGNLEWITYAREAIEILKYTRQVPHHHHHHDKMYELLHEWLVDQ